MSGKVLEDVKKATHDGDYKGIADIVSNALKQGADPMDVMQALSEGIISVSDEYKTKGMYLDNIVLAAAAFEVGMAQITPILEKEREKKEPLGKIVLGVVEGPWTIGKSIVAANLRAHGFEVIDAGSDVPPEKIAETTVESGANLVALGIYLTHAAPELAKLIGDTVTIMGNLNYNKLVNATPDEMYAACADAIRTAGPGGGYWLAFGCEIPREMPYKNIQAMVRAAKSVGKYPIQSTS